MERAGEWKGLGVRYGHSLFSVVLASLIFILGLLSHVNSANAEWVEWIADVGISYAYKENINNAFVSSEKKDDNMILPTIILGRAYQLTNFTRLALTADFGYNIHEEFTDLSNLTAGATLAITHKFGLGRQVPWLRATTSAAVLDFQGDDLRDGNLYTFNVQAGKRIHERLDVILAYTHENRNGNTSPSTFGYRSHTGAINLNLLLTKNTLLSLGYSIRDGDVTSTCSISSVQRVGDVAKDVQVDNAYEKSWCSYRIDATTNAYAINLSYAFGGGHYSLNFDYEYKDTDTSGFDYSSDIFMITVNYGY